MIGIILLFVSWLLLRAEARGLTELGFNAPRQRALEFATGFAIAALIAITQFLLISSLSGFNWNINPLYGYAQFLDGLRWNVNSVLYEELLFRGYLLWLAIRFLGVHGGCIVSAATFGIYHWFSFGVLGDLVTMAYVFAMTGVFGAMLAYSFAWTGGIWLPIALHFGWNIVTNEIFSNGPLGARLLIPSTTQPVLLDGMEQALVSIVWPLLLPLAVLLFFLNTKRAHTYVSTTR